MQATGQGRRRPDTCPGAGPRYHRAVTLPRILSAVGRTLAVLGAVMLLFVVFQLWGTGLQQAQAQSDLEGDLAERFRQAAEAGQAARTLTAGPPQAAAPGGPSPAGTAPAPPQPVGDGSGTAPAATGDAAPEAPASRATASGATASAGPAGGPATPADPGQPGSGAAVANTDEPRAAASDPGRSAAEAGAAGPAAGGATADTSSPAPLPDLPSAPRVVSHVSELAAARATARLLEPEVEDLLPLVYPEPGEAIARILIPSIDMDEIVVAGVDVEDLRKGPGHYSTTPLPGQPGNAAIAGHRTTYGAPFGRLAELNAGDAIIVETLQGRFTYRVLPGQPGMAGHALGFRIVAPTALEVLDDVGDNRLTLTSCHPKYSSKKRIIVHAALVGDPVVRLPRPGEPTGAEHVQLAQPGGPPPVPPNVAAPQTPTPETLPSGTIPSEPTPSEPTPSEAASPAAGPSEAASPAAASPAAASPAAGSSEAGGAGEGNQAGTSPGTAPELAGEPAGVATAAIAGDEPGTPVPESAGSGGDAGDPAATAEPPSPGTEPGALPSGETDGATVGAARGDSGQGGQSPQPAAANPATPQPPPAPLTSEGFGEGLSGDRDAILPAVLWGLAAAAVWALGWMFGRSGRRALRYTVAAVPFLVVIYVMFSYVDRALPAY